MKFSTTLALLPLTSAFVVPDEQFAQVALENPKHSSSFLDNFNAAKDDVIDHVSSTLKDAVEYSENAIDKAFSAASEAGDKAKNMIECYHSMVKFDTQGWLDSAMSTVEDIDDELFDDPHDAPPHRKPPHHKHPHHGHGGPNKTVYEWIASSKYTTELAKLINEYPDLVEKLNGTEANYTIFAPNDAAFKKIPDHGDHKPSKELIKKVLEYHVSPDFYPAGRVLVTHTIPTLLEGESLGGEPQRIRVGLGLKGLAVNFYSRVLPQAINIFGTNGVIHGIDSLLVPPPPALKIIEFLPGEFSTLQLALQKTDLFDAIAKSHHTGGTFFAPSNWAFQKLGPKINAFLFSKYGNKYLKALLKYHIVADQTLYSDAFYKAKGSDENVKVVDEISEIGESTIPKGQFHVDLPTLLEDKSLSIDVGRLGGFISIRINGFSSVSVQDGIAKDGVIHVLSSILIPPKSPGGAAWAGEELDLEDFKERLIPYMGEEL